MRSGAEEMTRPGGSAPEQAGPLDPEAYRHQMLLLKAMHHAYPVVHEGRQQFLQVLTPRLAGGLVLMDVYLQGRPAPIDSNEITLAEPA